VRRKRQEEVRKTPSKGGGGKPLVRGRKVHRTREGKDDMVREVLHSNRCVRIGRKSDQ